MNDPLEALLVETEGVWLVQAGPGEPATWLGSEAEARTEAQKQALALGKSVHVFRAVACVKTSDTPVYWIEYNQD